LDLEKEAVKHLRDLGYDVLEGDAQTFSLGKKFDRVVAGELIEHVENPGKMLERIRDHLAPGGKLVITTPNAWSFLNFIQSAFRAVSIHSQHVSWYDERTLLQLLTRSGFPTASIRFLPAPPQARGWLVSQILWKIGLRRLAASTLLAVCSVEMDGGPGPLAAPTG
jgi:SAM-dependent methyltransferase